MGDGVGGFERRDDAFDLGRQLERFERLVVEDRHIFDAAGIP